MQKDVLIRRTTSAVFIYTMFASPVALATNDCASIDDPSDRLACYDREFPPNPASTPDTTAANKDAADKDQDVSSQEKQTTPHETVGSDGNKRVVRESNQDAGIIIEEERLESAASASDADTGADKPANGINETTNDDAGFLKRGFGSLFSKKEPVLTESIIVALRRRESQNLIFLLANDQIWLQDAPRATDPFRQGDRITIRSGKIGGYFMTSENGTSTRVRRIK